MTYNQSLPDVSVVLPCLNEEDTLETCIRSIQETFEKAHLHGEIIVADNGSTDRSASIAKGMGVKVKNVPVRGYGSAIRGGVDAATSKFVIMADADGSYDFTSIPRFIKTLEKGYDLVMGNRFKGKIEHGAMPVSHMIGGTVLSMIGKILFHIPVSDFHCGIRGFRKDAFTAMDLHTDGMEFASEMIINAKKHNLRITEIPTILRKDGRIQHPPHLKTFRDGWRHLRYMLLNSRKAMLLYPGILLCVAGCLALFFKNLHFIGGNLPLAMAVLTFMLIGSEILVLFAQTQENDDNRSRELGPVGKILRHLAKFETGLIVGSAVFGLGAVFAYLESDFLPHVMFAFVIMIGGLQIILSSIALNIRSVQQTGKELR